VVVVGAGLAGLTVARRLSGGGHEVVVLEARDRVGGRTLNQDIGSGKVVEMGGQWAGPTQDEVYALAAELGVATFPTYVAGDEIAVIDGKRQRYSGEMPRINPLVLADFVQAVARLDRLAQQVPREAPWQAPKAHRWDSQTFETWLQRVAKTPKGRAMLRVYMTTLLATETTNFSLLHALFYVHSGTSFQVLASLEGGAQQDRFVGGSQLLAVRMAEQLGDAVVLGSPVWRISQRDNRVTVDSDRVTVTGRAVVVAVPPTLAARIYYDPPLPRERDQLLQRLPQGNVIKVNVVYDDPFWRAQGLKGFAWSPNHLVSFTLDNSPAEGSPGVLVGFIDGPHARNLAAEAPNGRRKLVTECLVNFFGPRAEAVAAYHELDWTAEPWTRGCFGAHFPPGAWTQHGPVLRQPVGAIHWAGTETASVWNGYMDGAIRSGQRAATEVAAALSL